MKKILAALALGATIMFSGCSGKKLDYYDNTTPKVKLEEYFTGDIKAWGVVQDWRGRVTRKFDVDIVGSWENGEGTLEEDFVYYDGEKQRRVWKIKKMADGTYEGRADDILDKAKGATNGNAVKWKYQMDLEVDGSTYRLTFDDWMFLMNDGVLINRSYLKKFGITVAELTLVMKKQ